MDDDLHNDSMMINIYDSMLKRCSESGIMIIGIVIMFGTTE